MLNITITIVTADQYAKYINCVKQLLILHNLFEDLLIDISPICNNFHQ